MPFLSAVLRWTPRGAIGFVVGAVAVITIFVNALFMQSGLHPAPLFKPPAFSDPIHRAPKAAAGAPAQPVPAPVTAKISHASPDSGRVMTNITPSIAVGLPPWSASQPGGFAWGRSTGENHGQRGKVAGSMRHCRCAHFRSLFASEIANYVALTNPN